MIFQVSSRKSYKHEDMEDEEETVVLFSREGEGSHDLDWALMISASILAPLMAVLNKLSEKQSDLCWWL